jgi:hypothetical protein
MAEDVSVGVLSNRSPEMGAEPPEDGACVLLAVAIDRKSADEHDSEPPLELLQESAQLSAELRQREVLFPDGWDLQVLSLRLG